MGLFTSLVVACAVCGAADKTLPANGSETPFDGRKRATLELRAASFETADRALDVVEMRVEPGFSLAASRDVLVGLEVPVLERTLTAGETTRTTLLGDVELRGTFTAWRGHHSRVLLTTALKLPTAPTERDPTGALVPPDLQPGCGSLAPVLGAQYVWSSAMWSAWTATSLVFPISVRSGAHPGDSLRGSVGMQLQPRLHFATRLSVNGRLDGTGEIASNTVKSSGGSSVYLAPELVISPTSDLVLAVGAAFPLIQEMRGYRATAPVLMASAGVDF